MSDPELWKQMQVKDVCTKPALSISPDASVLDAMKVLVEKRISGLPVADESGHVVGVISGYDLLLLESTPGHIDTSEGLFPPIGRCDEYGGKKELMWNSFNELRNAQARVRGESVGDVMHECTTISQDASLEDAASVLLANKQHRLAVVDGTPAGSGPQPRPHVPQYAVLQRSALAPLRDAPTPRHFVDELCERPAAQTS